MEWRARVSAFLTAPKYSSPSTRKPRRVACSMRQQLRPGTSSRPRAAGAAEAGSSGREDKVQGSWGTREPWASEGRLRAFLPILTSLVAARLSVESHTARRCKLAKYRSPGARRRLEAKH